MSAVDAVYVINLERSKDRMAFMHKQCGAMGLSYERVEAVDGSKISKEELRRVATPFCQKLCTDSMIGCALSHLKVWNRIAAEGTRCALIMEDDAELVPGFVDGLQKALRDVPKDFDILVLGCFFLCDKNRAYSLGHEVSRLFVPHSLRNDVRSWGSVFVPEYFAGSHCYIVSLQGCKKLLKLVKKANYHIDMEMNHPSLNLYAVSPDLAYQRNMADSTIASYKFPKTITPLMETIRDSKRISMAYYMDAPLFQLAGQRVNGWTSVFLVLGLMWRVTLPYVAGFLVAELLVTGDVLMPVVAYSLGWALRGGYK